MAATVQVKCKCCGGAFTARVADRKRGWARFCSKSCKAIRQTQRTGRGRPSSNADQGSNWLHQFEDDHPFSDGAIQP